MSIFTFWRRRTPDDIKLRDPQIALGYHQRLDQLLQRAVVFWQGVVDWDEGGFFGLVDYAGQPRPDADKDLIQQVRHLWTFANLYRFEDASEGMRAICGHQFEFVRDRLYIPDRAEFHRSVSAQGAPRPGGIHHYPLAFAIYGLSNYATAFPETSPGREALEIAKQVFAAMMEKSWDETHGFDETVYPAHWCADAKEINTQMHLLEAVVELFEAARVHHDPVSGLIRPVLEKQLELVCLRGIVERGGQTFCSRGYAQDWTLIDDREIDYGHDIEVVYLVMCAATALDRQDDPAIVERVARLAKSVSGSAFDRRRGKWYYSGNPITGVVHQRVSNVWTNFEALNGLSTVYELTGDVEYLRKFDRVLTWLESKQLHQGLGEWYYNVNDRGRPVPTDVFGADCDWMTFAWKSSYHSLRALMTRKRWVAETYLDPASARER